MSYTTSQSLLLRIRSGDEIAWDEFHQRYHGMIRWVAAGAGVHAVDADDIVQDVLLEIFKGQKTFRYDRGKGRFRDYLFVVARRCLARHFHRSRRQPQPTDSLPELVADAPQQEEWEAEWRRHVLREAIEVVRQAVEPSTFRAFELYELEGKPVEVVAAELGIAPASVYVYKKRVLRRLRGFVEELTEQ